MGSQLVMAPNWCGCGVLSSNSRKMSTNDFKLSSSPFKFSKPYPRSAYRVTAYYGLTTPPYELDALEPYMSKRTVEVHWGQAHNEHVEKLNKILKSSTFYGHTLEEMVKVTYNNGNPLVEFNDASSLWSHDFFWESMQPKGGSIPQGGVLTQIEKDFESFTNFKDEFVNAALSIFGSGWVWLYLKRNEKKLAVAKTQNAVSPLVWGDIPIIGLDMWEHAYYLDYKDDRLAYVNNFLDHLVSWHSVMVRMMRAEAFVNLGEPNIPEA
ncbi:superoxide dismutase [Carex littledalei]|uniref:superoxide dismutase n=1 Tax=Carex littledalei TaxID=544730 RepID=A0A833R328_9POAL|nr:superoxide dismutase [Carex littledalei]